MDIGTPNSYHLFQTDTGLSGGQAVERVATARKKGLLEFRKRGTIEKSYILPKNDSTCPFLPSNDCREMDAHSQSHEIRLGIVGLALGNPLGFFPLLETRGVNLAAIAFDPEEEEEAKRAETISRQWPEVQVVQSPAEMLRLGVDLIICSSQAHRHWELCREIIESRVPLFIDKPLAPDYASALRILDWVEKHDAPVLSCSVRRYSDNFTQLLQWVAEGKVGRTLFAECFVPHGTKAGYWQDVRATSGGLTINFGVHAVDPLIAGFGPHVKTVFAHGAKKAMPGSDSEDTSIIQMQFDDGLIALAKICGGYAYGKKQPLPTADHLAVHGTEGALETYLDESDIRHFNAGVFGISGNHLRSGTAQTMDRLVEMTRTGKRPVSLEEMDAVMKVLGAARDSIDCGRMINL